MTEDQMGNLYQRFPVTVERGLGARVWDASGREYIDCMGGYGVAVVGHRNPRVTRAIHEQADKITAVHASTYSPARERFLGELAKAAPRGLTGVHLNNSGAESVEAAVKFARRFTAKPGAVAMRGSYHGKSMGALSLTFNPKYRRPFEPLPGPVSFSPFGDATALEGAVTEQTGMVIMEPIQGESGIHVPPDGFLREARRICDERGALLVFDEIQAGLGRTGRMWASDHEGVAPDVMCVAKGIAGGVPMGATLVRQDVLESMGRGEHSSTFGGNPLACAAGAAALESIREDRLPDNAARTGRLMLDGLREMAGRVPAVREVRGRGLMIGVELKSDVRPVLERCMEAGLLVLYSGRSVVRLLPPLVLQEADAQRALRILEEAIRGAS